MNDRNEIPMPQWPDYTEELWPDPPLPERCPKCDAPIRDKWSGVVCSNDECDWWFCF